MRHHNQEAIGGIELKKGEISDTSKLQVAEGDAEKYDNVESWVHQIVVAILTVVGPWRSINVTRWKMRVV